MRSAGCHQTWKGTLLSTDRTLQCRDCGSDFVFSAGEQEFYASRGFVNAPTRCPDCRAAHKVTRGSGYGERAPRQLYRATCSSCGGEAQVPFQPRGDKPVYCSACFQGRSPR
jgi:CxxC-x17-CxxC domain-containing protein